MPSLGPLRRPLRTIRSLLPPFNFITIHYLYFMGTILLSAVIFWAASTPPRSVSFIDSLFLVTSAMTLAGLNTVNLSTLNTFQQFMLFALIVFGSAIFVSAFVVIVRKRAFEKKFEAVVKSRGRRSRRSTSRRRTFSLNRNAPAQIADFRSGDAIGKAANATHDQHTSDHFGNSGTALAKSHLNSSSERDQTPPARRGAPEMNGISSITGEPLMHTESNDPKTSRSPAQSGQLGITFRKDTFFGPNASPPVVRQRRSSIINVQGVGARPTASLDAPSYERPDTATSYVPQSQGDISRYFESVGGWISRNSEFHGLTAYEREELGGLEYRAVSLLAWLVPLYFVLWQLIGCIGCAAWVALNQPDTAWTNGLDPWWVGAFNAASAFNNSGMSLLDANMTAFQTSYYLLLTMGLLILAGNTSYPIFLRFIVWSMHKIVSRQSGDKWAKRAATLRFLLDHPRRCYTNLFPAQHTWWLLLSVIMLNGIDWAAFEILNLNNQLIDDQLPTNIRVIDGLFQAFAVRSGGFYVVPIPNVRISLQVLYVVMMYISVYPVVITMRNSNVYEERSLGIYADDTETADPPPTDNSVREKGPLATNQRPSGMFRDLSVIFNHFVAGGAVARESNAHFVRQQLRAQLAHDAWIIVLALFLIMIIENQKFVEQPAVFSVFNFIFEIVSAYGCVGISLGVPYDAYSFCGSWQTLSKLILCAVMLRGRHRGLPVAIDKAVLLPGEENWRAEEDDGRIRRARTMSRGRQETA